MSFLGPPRARSRSLSRKARGGAGWIGAATLALTLASGLACSGGGPPSPEEVAAGRQLYERFGCASCHGTLGHGDGPAAVALPVPPRDFRDATAFRGGADLDSVASTIAEGLPAGPRAMPPFPFIPAGERRLLAAYVLSLKETADAR